jgi:hypothetical protein
MMAVMEVLADGRANNLIKQPSELHGFSATVSLTNHA